MAPSAIETTTEDYVQITLKSGNFSDDGQFYGYNNGNDSVENAKAVVLDTLKNKISCIDTDSCEAGEEEAFFVADLGDVYRQHLRWKKNLKRVKPHYGMRHQSSHDTFDNRFSAVKCNPDHEVLTLLAALGNGFDCASKAEIDAVLKLGVDPSRIIYAQPCKTRSHIRHAAKMGVKQMTFDNADELYKIKELFPDAELFLRILTDDSSSMCRLSLKFGASLDSTKGLLKLAKALSLNVTGVSFHVGSGASDPNSFLQAVRDSRVVFDQAAEVGYQLKTLDVGGGFTADKLFEEMASVLRDALDQFFPPSVRVIGEPGRYFVSRAYTLACNVIARRDVHDIVTGDTSYMLYLNDGVYGNFSSIIFDHQHPEPHVLAARHSTHKARAVEYSLWGPTCDGIDRITDRAVFNRLLDVGDWLYFEEMGAYTRCSATRFNGFSDNHEVIYICTEPGASAMLDSALL